MCADSGFTALMEACKHKQIACVEALLAHDKCDLHQVNDDGASALHVCAESGFLPGVQALLRKGARLLVDYNDRTALSVR